MGEHTPAPRTLRKCKALFVAAAFTLLSLTALLYILISSPPTSGQDEIAVISLQEKTAVFSNPELLATSITFKPKISDGVMEGCVVSRLPEDSIFRQAGLRQGDLVIRVNSSRIDRLESALALKNTFSQGTMFEIDIERSGKPDQIRFAFR